MKCKRKYYFLPLLFISLLSHASVQGTKVTYATDRLKGIAEFLDLPGIESLSPGTYHSYTYQSHPITVRINKWHEVEHLGFRLFANDSVRNYNPSPVYDFLERYFLELKLPVDPGPVVRMFVDKVYIDGNIDDIFSFDGTEVFNESYVQSKSYAVSWTRNGKHLISATFDMNYQLLSGCNALELEANLLRDIQRYESDYAEPEALPEIKNAFEALTDMYVDRGNTYLVDLVRNDLYYVRKGDKYVLVNDEQKINQSVANMMLSPYVCGDFDLNVIFDKYGYKEERIRIKLKQWIGYCLSEGCTAYFGIKSKDDASLKGTVFMVNEKKGYNHVLSVDVPFRIVGKQEGRINARLYAYIPMHNVLDSYFEMK